MEKNIKKCKLCWVKAIEWQDLCWDCWVKNKSKQEKPIFEDKKDLWDEWLEMLKKMFWM